MSGCDFDWSKAKDTIVLQEQRVTAIYTNDLEGVVIRQAADYPHEETDPYIVIGYQNLRRVIARLTELADQIEFAEELEHYGADSQHQGARRDPTAAERQRRHRDRKRNGGNGVEPGHAEATE